MAGKRYRLLAGLLAAAAVVAATSLVTGFALPLIGASPRAAVASKVAVAAEPIDGGNLGGDFWPHPWAEELAESPKGDEITFEDVVEHFNAKREEDGLEPLEEMSSPLVILEGIVTNSELSGQPGMNKAQRIADGIQGSSFLLSELTS
eukprot:CAMPEP_0171100540 /NCGR_PEP_ID=MMETSP0766_2-20121228/53020_1 /TAXON_ID=439317 /ORGANISM="Gambierdiscus australes, Strain CAWD 149" /LENGTH=147 /DNA_ID=CAMNT_0011560385 /DNA_START=44 /DNA_END=487 /DNA_ORIENTATION=-